MLGAVLLSDTALPALIIDERLHPEDFYREATGSIFAGDARPAQRRRAGRRADAGRAPQAGRASSSRPAAARDRPAGASVPAVGNVRQYARIVRDNAMLRRLLRASYEIQARVHSHEAPPRDLVDIAERAILEVAHEDSRKDFRAIHDLLDAELDKLEQLSREGKAITGTPSGFDDLDTITGGFQPGNLIILAARPSMGKSALMANFAENAALGGEQGRSRCSRSRCRSPSSPSASSPRRRRSRATTCARASVPPSRWPKILQASNRLAQSPLFIDDSSDLSVLDVRAKARRLAQQHADGLGLILIDYLQLMRGGRPRRQPRRADRPDLARAQDARARARRAGDRPLAAQPRRRAAHRQAAGALRPARKSASIEQDADLVMFIYRDEYYDEESEREGIADLIISKHRNGGLGDVELTFQKEYPRFMSYVGDDRY